MKKRILSVLLCAAMLCGLLPVTAIAAESYANQVQTVLETGGTVVLERDVILSEVLRMPSGVTTVLDLNGYTITLENGDSSKRTRIDGQLTIMDSRGGGVVTYRNLSDYNILSGNSGNKFVITGGTFKCAIHADSLEITGGDFIGYDYDNTLRSVLAYNGTISGGTFNYRVQCSENLTISGGTFNERVGAVHGSTLTITGGTFNKPGTDEGHSVYSGINVDWASATVNISGGTFMGSVDSNSTSTLEISGGTFSQDVTTWVAEGYECKAVEETDTWIVQAAVSVPASYTVTFDKNGGTGTMEAATDISGEFTLPECAFTAPTGMTFKAWSVEGEEKNPGDTITVSADTTVTAVWTSSEDPEEPDDGHYDVWLAGVEFTADNLVVDSDDGPGISGSATFDPDTFTLTLNNFRYEGPGLFEDGSHLDEGIALFYSNPNCKDDYSAHGLNIVLVGENTLSCIAESVMSAIYIVGSTTISGSGSLVAKAESTSGEAPFTTIYVPTPLSVRDAAITVVPGETGMNEYGLFALSLDLTNATIESVGSQCAIAVMEAEYSEENTFHTTLEGHTAYVSLSADSSDVFQYPTDATYEDHSTYKYMKITPATAAYYDVWCGEVQFTSQNLVIDSTDNAKISGSATFDPETYTITLNNFKYSGRGYYEQDGIGNGGIALLAANPEFDTQAHGVNIVLIGENEITCVSEGFCSCAVEIVGTANISGNGSLIAKAVCGTNCESEDLEGVSCAFVSTATLTISNASVTAITDIADNEAYGIITSGLVLNNATLEASGYAGSIHFYDMDSANAGAHLSEAVTGHTAYVSDNMAGTDLVDYAGEDPATYKYLKIVPGAGFTFESIRTANGKNISVDHENKKISVEVDEGDVLTLYVHQKEYIPGGTVRMKSYNGNKVEYDAAGIYRVYSLYSEYITVFVNITIGDQTEVYELVVRFAEKATPVPFSSIRTENGTVTSIDHEEKRIYVDVNEGDDHLVLYVHQKEHMPGGQVRMNSYNGNKVTYDASGVYRIYTLGSAVITVSAKVIVGGETHIYDLVVNFNREGPGFEFEEIKCDNAQRMDIDHSAKTIRIYAKENAEYVTLYKKQYDYIKGTLVLTSFMGNRVQSNQTEGTYKVCFVKNLEVSVKGNFTINGVAQEYLITVVFSPEWKFDDLKIDSASSVSIDHDTKTITVDASSDTIVLYIDQIATKGSAQVWMRSYNGNKVTYNADTRTYTIAKGQGSSLTVSVKITIFGETRYYDMIVRFDK